MRAAPLLKRGPCYRVKHRCAGERLASETMAGRDVVPPDATAKLASVYKRTTTPASCKERR